MITATQMTFPHGARESGHRTPTPGQPGASSQEQLQDHGQRSDRKESHSENISEGGFMFGKACTPVVDSCQCMAKPIQYCKVK